MSDLISKEVLKKYMRDYKWEFALNSDFSKAIEMVDVQPTVEAVPVVHGEWIDMRLSSKDVPMCKCSECGHIRIGLETNFCPNCGADMRKKV